MTKCGHSISNVSYINEFKVGSSIADVAIFNGTSAAYEIKTEYDSFERLDSQLMSYQSVFDNVYVVVPESKAKHVETVIQPNIGIYVLTKRETLKKVRVAKSNIGILSKEMMFNSLRCSEYIELCKNKFSFTPIGRASEQKAKCLKLFLSLDNDIAHNELLMMLKKRTPKFYEKEVFDKLPESLLAAVLNLRLNQKSLANLQLSMEEKLGN